MRLWWDIATVLWWDWKTSQRLAVLAVMLVLAATPWLWISISMGDWRGFLGGTAFLLIPQLIGWLLFVGLKTGRMPTRGAPELRAESPTWFWTIAAMYAGLLVVFLGFILLVLKDALMPGL